MMVVLSLLLRPAGAPLLWRRKESSVCCTSRFSTHPFRPSSLRELLSRLTLSHPSQTGGPAACEWVQLFHTNTHTALPTLLSASYQAIVIPKWFFNNVTPRTIPPQFHELQTSRIASISSLRNTSSPTSPEYFTLFFLTCFGINRMEHWTNTKLDGHFTSLYSYHQPERNTFQIHANEV